MEGIVGVRKYNGRNNGLRWGCYGLYGKACWWCKSQHYMWVNMGVGNIRPHLSEGFVADTIGLQ